jgi:methylenetetrahydrofolate reductase (NADPH)
MSVIESIINSQETTFSFELLPPLKGNSIDNIYKNIERLLEFDPKCINITTHRSEQTNRQLEDGSYQQFSERRRPGTVAIAAAIQHKYKVPVVPHIICSGFTKEETEYALIDLNFLGIHDLLLLRGDKGKHETEYRRTAEGNFHALDLQQQVNDFNDGKFLLGEMSQKLKTPFSYGVAGYPEKHETAPSMESDIFYLKEKVKAGAQYIVTQMFFDNKYYFDFVARCRAEGITIPIMPGIKPITLPNQVDVLPRIFSTDIPEAFATELRKCTTKEQTIEVGIEWSIEQCKELKAAGVPGIHFYSLDAVESVRRVAQAIY